jgi:hypothetical protein
MSHTPLSNYLRTHRRRVCLSQDEVGYLLGLASGTNVSRHEHRARLPGLEAALSYEIVLGVPVRELFAGEANALESVIRRRAGRLLHRLSRQAPSRRSEQKMKLLRLLEG